MKILSKIEPGLGCREAEYREHFLREDTRFSISVIIILNAFMAVMVYNDFLLFNISLQFVLLLVCRSLFLLTSIAVAPALLRCKSIQVCDRIIFVTTLIYVICLSYIQYTKPPTYQISHVWNVLIIFWIYIFYPYNLVLRFIPALFFSATIITILFAQISAYTPSTVTAILFSILGANILGSIFSVRWNNLRRGLYKAMAESKAATAQFKENRQRLTEVIDFLPDPTFAIDNNHSIIIWNKATEKITGIPSSQMLGKKDNDYSVPFYGIRRPLLVDLVLERNEGIESNYLDIRELGNGTLVSESFHPILGEGGLFLWATSTPLCDSKGEIVGAIESFKDITERRRAEEKLQESELKFRAIFDQAAVGVCLTETMTCRLLQANKKYWDIIGYSEDEITNGLTFQEITHPDDLTPNLDKLRLLQNNKIHVYSMEKRYVRKNGATIWVNLTVSPMWKPGERPTQHIAVIEDITLRKDAEKQMHRLNAELQQSREMYKKQYKEARETGELYQSLLKSTLDPIVTYNTQSQVMFVNKAFEHTFGWSLDELLKGVIYTPDSEKEITRQHVEKVIRDGIPIKNFETARLTKLGQLLQVNISASRFNDHEGNPAGMVVILRDISEQKILEDKLKMMASTDPLTGAYNRRSFFEKGNNELIRTKRYLRPFGFLMIDVDYFKKINDAYGHHMGDHVLKKLVSCSHNILRETDQFGRLGGEEFAVILPETDKDASLTTAHRFLMELSKIRIPSDSGTIQFTVSIGLAMFEKDDDTLETIMGRADAALYKAKGTGRNRVVTA